MASEYTHPELVNIADDLKPDEVEEIAHDCLRNYEADEDSRQGWMENHAEAQRLYFQKDHPKNPPWEGSSTESMPMLAEACNQFYSRASQAMFPSRDIVKAIPVGKADEAAVARGERVGRHMSYQLTIQNRQYKRDKKRLLLSLPLHGAFFTKTFHCPIKKRNEVRNVRATDFVVPYGVGPRSLESIERKSEIIHMTVNQSKVLKKSGYFSDEAEPYQAGQVNAADEVQDRVQGLHEGLYKDQSTARLIEQHCLLNLNGSDSADPYIVTLDTQARKVLRIGVRWDTDELGDPTEDRKPIEYYTGYSFLENPDGFYGLGFWHIIGQLNIAANKLLRQNIDAGTLRNVLALSGFINHGLDVKGGEVAMQLGKFVKTASFTEDFEKSIWQPKVPGQDPTLLNLLQVIMTKSDRIASVTEAITGQTEAVMQPTTILALIDQSLQQFSSSFEGVIDSWTDELEKLYRLNYKFLDPQEYFSIQDSSEQVKGFEVARKDYAPDLQVTPIADPKLTSEKQKLAKAEAGWQHAMTNPLIANSAPHLREASRRFLDAIGTPHIDGILPDVTPQLPRVDDPMQENMGALSPVPMMPPAYPDQDHQLHIEAHYGLASDPEYGARLSPAGMQVLEEHINAHVALNYGRTESNVGMEAAAPDAEVPGGPGGEISAPGPVDGGGLAGELESIEGAV